MQWQSWSAFLAMDGYGAYIWGSFGVTALVMCLDGVQAIKRRHRAWTQAISNEEEV